MFFLAKLKDDEVATTSTDDQPRRRPPPLKRNETFSSTDVFRTWAKDSFLNDATIDVLVQTHQIDCLPAVLALQLEDIAQLGLAVGQQRLLEDAVRKLHQEYELVRPPTPRTKINLETPSYKTMIELENLTEIGSVADTADAEPVYAMSGLEAGEFGKYAQAPIRSSESEKSTLLEEKSTRKVDDGRQKSQRRSSERLVGREVGVDSSCLCACQRWLLVVILMPLLLVATSLGSILVLLIMPFRCCCGQGGRYTDVVTFLFDCFIMSPCRACQWASGAAEKQSKSDEIKQEHGTKSRYGGTLRAELGGNAK